MFITYNGGELWESWNDGLTNLRAGSSGNNVANPMVQSADGRYLYFGTFGSGVFRRTTFIPPTTTTTTTSTSPTTSPTQSPTPPNGPWPAPPVGVMIVIGGAVGVVIVLLLVIRRLRMGGEK